MLEAKTGVFVGSLSARVRERLWNTVCAKNARGASLLINAAATEQRFEIRTRGDAIREVVDVDGLLLMKERRR